MFDGAPPAAWPRLSASQRAAALSATWPSRLQYSFIGAAMLASVTAAHAFRSQAPGAHDPRVAVGIALACTFLCAYFVLRKQRISSRWLAAAGVASVSITLVNLTVYATQQVSQAGAGRNAAANLTLVIATMVAGTLWALLVQASPRGFALSAALAAGILWVPLMTLTAAPVQLGLAAAACVAAGWWMRSVRARQAYNDYRTRTVRPSLSRRSVQAAVLRELSFGTAAEAPAPAVEAPEPAAESLGGSLSSLASALGHPESPAPADAVREETAKTADSPA
jgi:hypothetical protein